MTPEVDALGAQCGLLDGLLSDLGPDEWDRPTRCPRMTVRELVAHLGWVFHRTAGQLTEEVDDVPVTDRFGWWDYGDPADIAELVVRTASEEAGARPGPDELVGWWREGVRAIVAEGLSAPPERVVRRDRPVRAGDLVATRVLEATVHGMDIGHATLRGERADPAAVALVLDILDARLPEPLPRQMGWDKKTYILTATGRRPLNAAERWTLGPLAEHFPLVS